MEISGNGVKLEATRDGRLIVTVEATGRVYQVPLTGIMPNVLTDDLAGELSETVEMLALLPWTREIPPVRASSFLQAAPDAGTNGSTLTVGDVAFTIVTDGTAASDDEINAGIDGKTFVANIAHAINARTDETKCTAYTFSEGLSLYIETNVGGAASNSIPLFSNDPALIDLPPLDGAADSETAAPQKSIPSAIITSALRHFFNYAGESGPSTGDALVVFQQPATRRTVSVVATAAGTSDTFVEAYDGDERSVIATGVTGTDFNAGSDEIEFATNLAAWLDTNKTALKISSVTDHGDGTVTLVFDLPGVSEALVEIFSNDPALTFTETQAYVAPTVQYTTASALRRPDSYLFADLPASPTLGDMAIVTDADSHTWNDPVVGGGSNTVLAWFDGSNWRIYGAAI